MSIVLKQMISIFLHYIACSILVSSEIQGTVNHLDSEDLEDKLSHRDVQLLLVKQRVMNSSEFGIYKLLLWSLLDQLYFIFLELYLKFLYLLSVLSRLFIVIGCQEAIAITGRKLHFKVF